MEIMHSRTLVLRHNGPPPPCRDHAMIPIFLVDARQGGNHRMITTGAGKAAYVLLMTERAERPTADSEAEPAASEKRVTWAELFFDLVFVFAITQVSGLLHEDHTWAGLGRALVVFVPIYWAWVGTSVHANTHEIDPLDRLGIFAVGLCALFMAMATPDAYAERGVLFGAAYYGARIVLAFLIFRGRGMTLSPFSVALFFSGPLLLIGGFFDDSVRVALWAVAALADLSAPRLLRRRLLTLRFDSSHMQERFGLLVLIALGE